jgi:hypothetical protein
MKYERNSMRAKAIYNHICATGNRCIVGGFADLRGGKRGSMCAHPQMANNDQPSFSLKCDAPFGFEVLRADPSIPPA